MANTNLGPAITSNPNTTAALAPVNSGNKPVEVGTNMYRLLAVARGVSLATTGDAAVMTIINSSNWTPAIMLTSNGQVSGAGASVATAQLGIFTAAAAGGTAIKSNAALTNNSAANSSIAVATTVANLSFPSTQTLYVNVGTALANATVDIFLYGYDNS